jgi:hypothetical protein
MKYILTSNTDGTIYGSYNSIVEQTDDYLANGEIILKKEVTGPATISEVPDDWVDPSYIAQENAAYNKEQSIKRQVKYTTISDPIYFLWQRGQATEQDWLDAVASIKLEFPYKPGVVPITPTPTPPV